MLVLRNLLGEGSRLARSAQRRLESARNARERRLDRRPFRTRKHRCLVRFFVVVAASLRIIVLFKKIILFFKKYFGCAVCFVGAGRVRSSCARRAIESDIGHVDERSVVALAFVVHVDVDSESSRYESTAAEPCVRD